MAKDDRARSALKTYREKRNFDATPEPAEGGEANESARAFVIQKHWARRLHYDFRLELDGTMKSWAVPKGPSYDPHDKRMAVPTEDHPIAYNRFEGTIPAGNYGAGQVIIWDKGTWIPLDDPHRGLREGKLKFELRGHKMHGHWTLVGMKGRGAGRADPWLLVKERDAFARPADAYSVVNDMPDSVKTRPDRPAAPDAASPAGPPSLARPAPLPATLQPQLATLVDAPPDDPAAWLYEIKFDGYRMLARVERGGITLVTRNGHDWTGKLGPLVEAMRTMDLPDGWYDGEIVLPDPGGAAADFQALQGAFETRRVADVAYYLFDLPFCAQYDLRPVPLDQRRAVLKRIVERHPSPKVRFSAEFEAAPDDILRSACELGLEGVIAKRRDAPYHGRRSGDWLKLKCSKRQEFVIGGWTDPKGSRTGIGALLLGVHDGGHLRYAGNVGTGFSDATLRDLRARLDALATGQSPFGAGTGLPRGAHWVRPELVGEVAFGEWTREGKVRHAVFHGLREDKPARVITEEKAAPAPRARRTGKARGAASAEATAAATTRSTAPKRSAAIKGSAAATAASRLPPNLRVSHPERIVDPASGITKLDLVRYYALVAPLMMEHLRHRPIAMVRAPDGIAGALFFQKHLDRYKMPGVVQLDPAIFPGHPPMLEIASPEGLLSAAQMNMVEVHTWNGVTPKIDRPDRMTFDIDPGEGVTWTQIREAAHLVRALLQELGLPAWLKTSGGKGLHIVVPLKPQFDWDTVKDFSQAVVQHLARTLPDRFVAKSGPKNRVGRIYIDYLRNGYGATTACAWSARARPGLGISVPVRWDELDRLSGGAHWTVATVHERLDQGNTPWEGAAKARASLQDAMRKLGFQAK